EERARVVIARHCPGAGRRREADVSTAEAHLVAHGDIRWTGDRARRRRRIVGHGERRLRAVAAARAVIGDRAVRTRDVLCTEPGAVRRKVRVRGWNGERRVPRIAVDVDGSSGGWNHRALVRAAASEKEAELLGLEDQSAGDFDLHRLAGGEGALRRAAL